MTLKITEEMEWNKRTRRFEWRLISGSSAFPSFQRPEARGGHGSFGRGGFCTGPGICAEDALQSKGLLPAFPVGSERAAFWFEVNSWVVLSKKRK